MSSSVACGRSEKWLCRIINSIADVNGWGEVIYACIKDIAMEEVQLTKDDVHVHVHVY